MSYTMALDKDYGDVRTTQYKYDPSEHGRDFLTLPDSPDSLGGTNEYRINIGSTSHILNLSAGGSANDAIFGPDSLLLQADGFDDSALVTAMLTIGDNPGATTLTDATVTDSPSQGDEQSYGLDIDGIDLLTLFAEADGAGGTQGEVVTAGRAVSAPSAVNYNDIRGVS